MKFGAFFSNSFSLSKVQTFFLIYYCNNNNNNNNIIIIIIIIIFAYCWRVIHSVKQPLFLCKVGWRLLNLCYKMHYENFGKKVRLPKRRVRIV